ncbi:MAG: hypothetical protein AMXMBFR75_33250 [Candidatus Hinthialibacteria bacterium]
MIEPAERRSNFARLDCNFVCMLFNEILVLFHPLRRPVLNLDNVDSRWSYRNDVDFFGLHLVIY